MVAEDIHGVQTAETAGILREHLHAQLVTNEIGSFLHVTCHDHQLSVSSYNCPNAQLQSILHKHGLKAVSIAMYEVANNIPAWMFMLFVKCQ